jgi:hypothetical protein
MWVFFHKAHLVLKCKAKAQFLKIGQNTYLTLLVFSVFIMIQTILYFLCLETESIFLVLM